MNPPRVLQSEWKYIRFYTGILVLLRCGKGSEAKTCAQPEMLEQTTMGAFDIINKDAYQRKNKTVILESLL